MDLVAYSQYYRTRSPERQLEIDECLRRNLNHPGISRMVLFCESDAPPVPEGTVPVEVVNSDERITYAEWFRWVQRQGSGIGLLLNADMYLDEGLEHLEASFNRPDAFLALTRYNPGHAGFHLNDYPHWTQDVWGVRADADQFKWASALVNRRHAAKMADLKSRASQTIPFDQELDRISSFLTSVADRYGIDLPPPSQSSDAPGSEPPPPMSR